MESKILNVLSETNSENHSGARESDESFPKAELRAGQREE